MTMTPRQYMKLKAEIEREYAEKLKALNLLCGGHPPVGATPAIADRKRVKRGLPSTQTPDVTPGRGRPKNYGDISALVRKVVDGLGVDFMLGEVEKRVAEASPGTPTSSVRGALRRMIKKGLLKRDAGRGSKMKLKKVG